MFEEELKRLEEIMQQEEFTIWLSDREDTEQVGLACAPSSCPLAQYLYAQGYSRVSVDHHVIQADCVAIPMSAWVELFISHVDLLEDEQNVTKAMAMQFLSEM